MNIDNGKFLGRKVRFKEGNKINYFQDFRNHIGIPSDVTFEIYRVAAHNGFSLVAPGYGRMEHYGNGSIFVNANDVFEALMDNQI